MITIDKFFIKISVSNYAITEGKLYGIIDGKTMEVGKDVLPFPFDKSDEDNSQNYEYTPKNQEEEINKESEVIQLHSRHLTEARSEAMRKLLIDFEDEYISVTDSCNLSIHDDYARYSSYNNDDYKALAIHFLNREKLENSMKILDSLAFLKAKKMFWESIIDSRQPQNSNPDNLQDEGEIIHSIL